jgi:hypothetical protein
LGSQKYAGYSATTSGRLGNSATTQRIKVLTNYRPDLYMKGKRKMNDFHDTTEMPDFDRTVWLVKKDRNGKNDWWTVDLSKAENGLFLEQWFKDLCDKEKFFAWSYRPYGVKQ